MEGIASPVVVRLRLREEANKEWISSHFDQEIAKILDQHDHEVQFLEFDSSSHSLLFAIYESDTESSNTNASVSSLLEKLKSTLLNSGGKEGEISLFSQVDITGADGGLEIVHEDEGEQEETLEESEALALLDAQEEPLKVCRRLFFLPIPTSSSLPITSLYREGYFIQDNFVCREIAVSLRNFALRQFQDNFLRAAGDIGADALFRGDQHRFLRLDDPQIASCPNVALGLSILADLGTQLSQSLRLRRKFPKFQLAVYPAHSTRYERHRDAYPEDGNLDGEEKTNGNGEEEYDDEPWRRRITAILYCNEEWIPSHGGELRIWSSNNIVDVEPIPARLVVFLSGAIEHEVRPSHIFRVAYTAWFS